MNNFRTEHLGLLTLGLEVVLIKFLGGLGSADLYDPVNITFQVLRHCHGMHFDVICSVVGTPLGSHVR